MPDPSYRLNRPVLTKPNKRYHVLTALLILIAIAAVFGVVIALTSLKKLDKAQTSSPRSKTTILHYSGPPTYTFKSEYFGFSDSNKWVFAANDSTANKFTYLLYSEGVPARSLTVYVNQTPLYDALANSMALPVQVVNENSFSIGSISAPCSTLYGSAPKVIKPVSMSGTSFICVPDSPQYTIIVGRIGGNYNLTLTRANGQTADYIIMYHDLSVNPDPSAFLYLIKSFKAI
jgi:hypothetical protein